MILRKTSKKQFIRIIAIIAAILYSSWPLGAILNPKLGTKALASELAASGQPYNWLFAGGDIASSVLIVGICIALIAINKQLPKHKMSLLAIASVALFAVGTITDALLPLDCNETVQQCPSYHQDHLLLIHGLFSIGASIFLFIGLFALWWQQRKNHLLNGIMIGYILFGIFSLISAIHPGRDSWAQHYYISLCSVCISLFPVLIKSGLSNVTLPNQTGLHTNRS